MNDLLEILEDLEALEALDTKGKSLQDLVKKWNDRVDAAEEEFKLYVEMDDGA